MSWDEYTRSDEWQAYVKHLREKVIPNLEQSNLFVSIIPPSEQVDIKFAVELGLAIMYNKPIVACIQPGREIPEKLAKVVDRFVELDLADPTQRERFADTIKDIMDEGI